MNTLTIYNAYKEVRRQIAMVTYLRQDKGVRWHRRRSRQRMVFDDEITRRLEAEKS